MLNAAGRQKYRDDLGFRLDHDLYYYHVWPFVFVLILWLAIVLLTRLPEPVYNDRCGNGS